MKNLLTFTIGLLFFTSSTLLAHSGGHSHAPVKAEKAKIIAGKVVKDAIKRGKVDKSWSDVKPNKPTTKDYGKGPEWVVTFDNPKIKDKTKRRLFVFLSISGEPLGLNFTGN